MAASNLFGNSMSDMYDNYMQNENRRMREVMDRHRQMGQMSMAGRAQAGYGHQDYWQQQDKTECEAQMAQYGAVIKPTVDNPLGVPPVANQSKAQKRRKAILLLIGA